MGEWAGGKVGGSWFYSSVRETGWIQDFIFLFTMLIKGTKVRNEILIFLRDCRDGKNLLRLSGSC